MNQTITTTSHLTAPVPETADTPPVWAFGGAGDAAPKDEKPTLGERAARWMTEGGLNWLANSGISLVSTQLYNQFLVPTKTMQNFFNNWVDRSAGPDASEVEKFKSRRAKMDVFETGFMTLWGTMLMIPYKWMRDHTQKRGYQYDKLFERWGLQKKGTAEAKAAARGEDMNNPVEQKLSWGDLLISRVVGLIVAIYGGLTLENHATGRWFKGLHPDGADKGEQRTVTRADGSIGIEDNIEQRGMNFKHGMYRIGKHISRSLENTAIGKRLNVTASTDPYITRPTPAEGFVFLVGKELTLTGILAMTMPTVLGVINKLRGRDKPKPGASAVENTNTRVSDHAPGTAASHGSTKTSVKTPHDPAQEKKPQASAAAASTTGATEAVVEEAKEPVAAGNHRKQADHIHKKDSAYATQEGKTENYKSAVRTGHLAPAEENFDGVVI